MKQTHIAIGIGLGMIGTCVGRAFDSAALMLPCVFATLALFAIRISPLARDE